jgi:hypothetical protein
VATENKTEQTENTEKKIKRIPLKDLGMTMPLGILTSDGNYAKSFGIKRWRMKEERELGELRDQNRDASVGQFVATVLSAMCTNVGNHDFEKLKPAEKMVHLSQMFVGDVFYLYTWLRLKSLGPQLKLDIKCPNCSNKFKFSADLNTVEVDTCDRLEDAYWDYKLEEPFEIRNKEVTEFRMGPPRWITLENMKGIGGLNTGAAKAGMILGSIVGIKNWKDAKGEPTPVALAVSELDDMAKVDIEGITSMMDENAIGPNMAIEGECPRCRSNYVMPIDWSYDHFFGASSR